MAEIEVRLRTRSRASADQKICGESFFSALESDAGSTVPVSYQLRQTLRDSAEGHLMLYVYVTPECESEARKHAHWSNLDEFRQKLERDQHATILDELPKPFLKKSFGRSFRLLATERFVDGHQVICFERFLPRTGGGDYERLMEDIRDSARREELSKSLLDHGTLRHFVNSRADDGTIAPLPEPDEREAFWLGQILKVRTEASEDFVLESREWVHRVKELHAHLSVLHNLIESLGSHQSETVLSNDDIGIAILYKYFPESNRFLLWRPLLTREDSIQEHRSKFEDFLRRVESEGDSLVLRSSMRSYPHYLVADQEAWMAIQEDEEANLALSPEETEILDSVRSNGRNGHCYPLFINGRAGSGKSTMIQHLIREYLEFLLEHEDQRVGAPLFMTCSRNLLKSARESVERLLRSHYESLADNSQPSQDEIHRVLDKSFKVFSEYLVELLPRSLRIASFQPDKYCDYSRFCRLWERDMRKRPETRKLSADLAWHTIRTFIKGMRYDPDDYLDPASYADLGRKQQSITRRTFEVVHDMVWERWYRPLCEEEGYWDDQDLAAAVLAHTEEMPAHPAVFCDEAQDFTRLELELIFRMSLFSRRSISPYQLKLVPFAFAGDPYQTLNPTGFRWENVHSTFHEKIVQSMDPTGQSGLKFNYQELTYNYRSAEDIVKFCNLIQLLRAAMFGIRRLEPQASWEVEGTSAVPRYFDIGQAAVRESIAEQPDLVIVVNCGEGEEEEYVEGDAFLRRITNRDERGIPQNVMSPVRAKGLEFSRVVLYKFGDNCPEGLRGAEAMLEWIASDTGSDDDKDRSLPLEYFFNRLYVAASRAKRRLFIVDTADGLAEFWSFAREPDNLWPLTEHIPDRNDWEKEVQFLTRGTDEDWRQDHEDPHLLAEQLRDRGLAERDPHFLRQARLYYQTAEKQGAADECLAEALAIERRFTEAGERFVDLGKYQRALDCFWKDRAYGRIRKLPEHSPDIQYKLEFRAAMLLAEESNANAIVEFLESIAKYARERDGIRRLTEDIHWHDTVRDLSGKLGAREPDELPRPEWMQVFHAAAELRDSGLEVEDEPLIKMAFRAKLFEQVVNLAEETGTKGEEYNRAKAEVTPFPEKIEWLGKLPDQSQDERIISEWKKAGATAESVDEKYAGFVEKAYRNLGDYRKAFEILRAAASGRNRMDRLAGLLGAAAEDQCESELLQDILVEIAHCLCREGQWERVIVLTKNAEEYKKFIMQNITAGRDRIKKEFTNVRDRLHAAIVEECAVSESLPKASEKVRREVSEYLRELLIGEPVNWPRWKDAISLETAGAAIERAGRIIDALGFYEWAVKRDDPREQRFATERLIRCREKRAEFCTAQGDTQEAERALAKADRLRAEAHWLSEDQKIPEFPLIGEKRSEPRQTDGQALHKLNDRPWSAGSLRFRWFEQTQKLRMVDDDSDFTGYFFPVESRLVVNDDSLEPVEENGSLRWHHPEWGITWRLQRSEDITEFVIERDGESVERINLSQGVTTR